MSMNDSSTLAPVLADVRMMGIFLAAEYSLMSYSETWISSCASGSSNKSDLFAKIMIRTSSPTFLCTSSSHESMERNVSLEVISNTIMMQSLPL